MTPSPTVAGSAIGPTPELQRDLSRRLDKLRRVFDLDIGVTGR